MMTMLTATPALLATVTQLLLGLCCVCAPGGCEECHHLEEAAFSVGESELPHLTDASHEHTTTCEFHASAFVPPEKSLRVIWSLNPLQAALPANQQRGEQQLLSCLADRQLGSPHCGLQHVALYLRLGVLLV